MSYAARAGLDPFLRSPARRLGAGGAPSFSFSRVGGDMNDSERCCLCQSRFRADDAIGTWAGGEAVHGRCVPETPDAELEHDGDDAVKAA